MLSRYEFLQASKSEGRDVEHSIYDADEKFVYWGRKRDKSNQELILMYNFSVSFWEFRIMQLQMLTEVRFENFTKIVIGNIHQNNGKVDVQNIGLNFFQLPTTVFKIIIYLNFLAKMEQER